MIPKKIHYCWFGKGPKPKLTEKCIVSWKKYCPDYEIIEWNEDNFKINTNPYTEWCYENKKYAFLSDYIRLAVIEEYGGIYLDTDVELIRSLDNLLRYPAYFGFETNEYVNTGLGFGAEAHSVIVQQMIKEYEKLLDGKHGTIGCPHLNTDALLKFGILKNGKNQRNKYGVILSSDYFNPYDAPTGRLNIVKQTYSIHWYAGTWMSKKQRIRSNIGRPLHRILGKDFMRFFGG